MVEAYVWRNQQLGGPKLKHPAVKKGGVRFMGYDDNESVLFDERGYGKPAGVKLANYPKFKRKYVSNRILIKCKRVTFK